MTRRTLFAVLLSAAGSVAAANPPGALAAARKAWSKADAAARVALLAKLEGAPDEATARQAARWLKEAKEPAVQRAALRLLFACGAETAGRATSLRAVAGFLDAHLDWRARKEKEEFQAVLKKFGRKPPPEDHITAMDGSRDPYDDGVRALPREIQAERQLCLALLEGAEALHAKELSPGLHRLFAEHHDPEVLAATARAFGALQDWGALPAMADLFRIQHYGREIGGPDVIGAEKYATLRLKWDKYQDRLWWSRPEYVLRVRPAIASAASRILGLPEPRVSTPRKLDRWLLDHAAILKRHGVVLDAAFVARTAVSQR